MSDSQQRYEQLLGTIEKNTGGPTQYNDQPPGVPKGSLYLMLVAHSWHSVDEVDRSIQAARENEDIFEWRDRDGTHRFSLNDEDSLKAIVAVENAREEPNTEAIEQVVAQL